MKKKTLSDLPVGELKQIFDFLPAPSELFPVEDVVKITLSVDSETLKFFKSNAKLSGKKYQRMMREVLKGYATKYKKSA
jgi:predicted DNA binding CopG/RHH family protein